MSFFCAPEQSSEMIAPRLERMLLQLEACCCNRAQSLSHNRAATNTRLNENSTLSLCGQRLKKLKQQVLNYKISKTTHSE